MWRKDMLHNEEKSGMVYLLAGVGLGAIIGTVAGLLFAPKRGDEMREDISEKFKELKDRTEEWMAEHKAKRAAAEVSEKLGL